MANELIKPKFELQNLDPKKTWGTIMSIVILAGLALLFYMFILIMHVFDTILVHFTSQHPYYF